MGLATIINMIVFVCVPKWGYRAEMLVELSHTLREHKLMQTGLGIVVDRCCHITFDLLLSAICGVRVHLRS